MYRALGSGEDQDAEAPVQTRVAAALGYRRSTAGVGRFGAGEHERALVLGGAHGLALQPRHEGHEVVCVEHRAPLGSL